MKRKDDTPLIQIGKQGVTESIIAEISAQLKRKKVLKVRMLKSALGEKDKREIAEEVAVKARAVLSDVRGNTFTLKKR
ncbi:MAG: YhbY family RNA-binding protein [Candidatus Altiarchaeota archaeon]|nr:YhbY family RNA-binding protein [Candidatus Altiarchaeota archaeon]